MRGVGLDRAADAVGDDRLRSLPSTAATVLSKSATLLDVRVAALAYCGPSQNGAASPPLSVKRLTLVRVARAGVCAAQSLWRQVYDQP